jgi:predicted ATPase
MPQHKLDDSLKQLVDIELMYRQGRLPDAEYTFKHALVRDSAYSTLLRARRHDLHRRIARAIEARFPERIENEPELLAYHFTEAGLTELAVEYG